MKILVITSRDLEKGSTKYRIAQFEEYLKTKNIHLEYVRRKEIDRSLLRRISEFDLVYNQKCLINSRISKQIFKQSRKTLFDFDDAIYTRPGDPRSFITTWRVRKRLHLWLRQANIVTTANRYLAGYARRYSSSVVVVPMAIDMEIWKPRDKNEGEKVTMGWAGSPGNVPNVERLEPVLSVLLKRHPNLKLAVFSGRKPVLSCAFDYHPFRPGAEPEFVQSLDIGLLPLIDEEYSRGKSPIKAIQYLACAVPVVGNVSGATAEILNESNSVAVSSDREWTEALEGLIQDLSKRKTLGSAGRQFALEHHDTRKVRKELLGLFIDEKGSCDHEGK